MTTGTNTQTIQQAYAAIAAQDIPAFQRLMARDIVWIVPEMSRVPFAGEWRGHERVAEFFTRLDESQEIVEFQPAQFVAQETTVVVLGHFVLYEAAKARLGEQHLHTGHRLIDFARDPQGVTARFSLREARAAR